LGAKTEITANDTILRKPYDPEALRVASAKALGPEQRGLEIKAEARQAQQ